MTSTLIVTRRTWAFRGDLKALGGHWRPDLRAWIIPVSRRDSVDELTRIADVRVGHYDTATGRITPLPPSPRADQRH